MFIKLNVMEKAQSFNPSAFTTGYVTWKTLFKIRPAPVNDSEV